MLNKHILLKLVILGLWLGSHLCIRVYYTLDGKEVIEINVFKYELIKMLIDRVINDFDDEMEEEMDIFSKNQSNSKSFNLAFNTLIQYGIILEI